MHGFPRSLIEQSSARRTEKTDESEDWDTPGQPGNGESELVRPTPSNDAFTPTEAYITSSSGWGRAHSRSHTNQELSDELRTKKPPASRVRQRVSFDPFADTVTQRVPAATVSQSVVQFWAGSYPPKDFVLTQNDIESETGPQEIEREWQNSR